MYSLPYKPHSWWGNCHYMPVTSRRPWRKTDLRGRNFHRRLGGVLLEALVVDDGEGEKVAVASDREDVLVVETARQLRHRSAVVVVHREAPVRTHQTRIVVVYRLNANAAVVHSENEVLVAVDSGMFSVTSQ